MTDGVWEPGPEDLEDEGVLDASDTLDTDPVQDPLDTGVLPPDRWSPGERYGDTWAEEHAGESLDQHLAEEEPEPDPFTDEQPDDEHAPATEWPEEEDPRAGRLVADDEGTHPDETADLVGHDVGIDAGAAGAEEAAVHIVQEEEQD